MKAILRAQKKSEWNCCTFSTGAGPPKCRICVGCGWLPELMWHLYRSFDTFSTFGVWKTNESTTTRAQAVQKSSLSSLHSAVKCHFILKITIAYYNVKFCLLIASNLICGRGRLHFLTEFWSEFHGHSFLRLEFLETFLLTIITLTVDKIRLIDKKFLKYQSLSQIGNLKQSMFLWNEDIKNPTERGKNMKLSYHILKSFPLMTVSFLQYCDNLMALVLARFYSLKCSILAFFTKKKSLKGLVNIWFMTL